LRDAWVADQAYSCNTNGPEMSILYHAFAKDVENEKLTTKPMWFGLWPPNNQLTTQLKAGLSASARDTASFLGPRRKRWRRSNVILSEAAIRRSTGEADRLFAAAVRLEFSKAIRTTFRTRG